MTPDRRRLLALLGATAISACARPIPVTRSGDPFEGGIGGTGIVGILTGLSSLEINGLRVEMTDRTRVESALGPLSASALAPGMSLAVSAQRRRDRMVANSVTVDFGLVGTAREIDGGLFVNGVPVRVEPGALGRAANGDRVAVSGAWGRGGYVASRIAPEPSGADVISGDILRDGPTGVMIGGVPLRMAANRPPTDAFATVRGRYDGETFLSDRFTVGRFSDLRSLRQLSVEGYLRPTRANPSFRIDGLGHSFAQNLSLAPLADRRAIYFGRYTGRFDAVAGYVVPEDFAARRALLSRGFAEGFGGQIIPV